MKDPHTPVLVREILGIFEGVELKIFFEGTVGAGGHAEALLRAHPEIERYLACDRDPEALGLARERLRHWWEKVEWIRGPFSEIESYLDERNIPCVEGCLFDLGVSSMQLEGEKRGFSFRFDAPLDMRMDPDGEVTAAMLIDQLSEKELAHIFYEYGGEFRSRRAAQAIVKARKKKKIQTTGELVAVLESVLWRRGRLHPATKVFQALRIAVNDELGQLKKGFDGAVKRLCSGGRIAVLSFHSLEDRMVKECFREKLTVLTKKAIAPSAAEMKANPRSRSAHLRAARKGV